MDLCVMLDPVWSKLTEPLSVPLLIPVKPLVPESSVTVSAQIHFSTLVHVSVPSVSHKVSKRRHVSLIPRSSSSHVRKKRQEGVSGLSLEPPTGSPQTDGSPYLPLDLLLSSVHSS